MYGHAPVCALVYVGGGVKHLNVFYFYRLGMYVHDLKITEAGIMATPEIIGLLVHGADALKDFYEGLDGEDQVRFRSSVETAKKVETLVRNYLRQIADASKPGAPPMAFTPETEKTTKDAVRQFEIVLNKELNDLPVFCVGEKGNYSLTRLIKGASGGYPATATAKLPDKTRNEIDEAGRCLAFARPTACGFHILRAVELVVKAYIVKLGLPMPPPNRCNWGEYIQILRTGNAPKEVTDLLQIIKDDYRNPIMHPEELIEPDEAVSLFGICQSTIEILCRHIPQHY
jgi:hypothetical protein